MSLNTGDQAIVTGPLRLDFEHEDADGFNVFLKRGERVTVVEPEEVGDILVRGHESGQIQWIAATSLTPVEE